jgi:PhzF family phenazine biosynthesis protein
LFFSLGTIAMGLPLIEVDAFTDEPFAGNPAAVCLLSEARTEKWMQNVAQEINLSETAYLLNEGDHYRLRWFTPAVEVDLCGHATLASAHALWEEGRLPRDRPARFETRSGPLAARRRGEIIEVDMPAKPMEPAKAPPELLQGLGAKLQMVGMNEFDYLAMLESEDELRALKPDFGLLAKLPVRGVIVTSRSRTAGFDFVSRFFAPAAGIDEDPVTGSAHCCLGPFWKDRLGKPELVGYQASPRGGVVHVRVEGKRVFLGGKAVTVWRGELLA